MDVAAANGHLAVVTFLHERRSEGCTTNAMDRAAWSSHFKVIRFFHEHRTEGCTTVAMDAAVAEGDLTMRYLHENRTEGCTPQSMNWATSRGHLDVVKFLHDHRRRVHHKINGRREHLRPR